MGMFGGSVRITPKQWLVNIQKLTKVHIHTNIQILKLTSSTLLRGECGGASISKRDWVVELFQREN